MAPASPISMACDRRLPGPVNPLAKHRVDVPWWFVWKSPVDLVTDLRDIDENGDLDQLFSYGARSFTIWNAGGELVWDSGDLLEQLTAAMYPDNFNASNTNNEIDNRSDNKGPEPESVAIARLFGETYAFIGLERIGGVAVYDVGNPERPMFIDYINRRDFSFGENDYVAGDFGGDLGPEGILVIDRMDSPAKTALLVVANEISGTTSIFSIEKARKKTGRDDDDDD